MKHYLKISRICFFGVSTLLLSSCVAVPLQGKESPKSKHKIQVELTRYKQSDFKQVEATFFTEKSKQLVFRVLSNVEKTSQWLDRVESVEVLNAYNNHQYLLRTIINSPWPFKDRELITCVNTFFDENITTINIFSCSDRVPKNDLFVRILQVESSWTIKRVSASLVEVNYKAWLDPEGYVPGFIFNRELIKNTNTDLKKLYLIINNASLQQYSY